MIRTLAQAVRQVTGARHYFHLLGVHRHSSAMALIRARKDLAMHVHPDQNSAPDAHDMMARVNAAFQALSADPEAYVRALGGRRCAACEARGYTFRQRGFTKRVETICPACCGAGVV